MSIPFVDEVIARSKAAWENVLAEHRKMHAKRVEAFIQECMVKTEKEIETQEKQLIEQFKADMSTLEEDRLKPKALKFILDGREAHLKRQFQISMAFLAGLRKGALESYLNM